jgi:hypothetical protein
MKLSQWAKAKGLSYKTAYRMFQAGTLPVKTEQLPTGTILVYPDQPLPLERDCILTQLDILREDVQEIKRRLAL